MEVTINLDALKPLNNSALPSEFRLFQFGDNPTSKGTFKLDEAGAKSVMARYKSHGIELHVDFEHDQRNAAAWFVPEVRADGLYATNVRWTPRAAEYLRGREYRYFSPTFRVDENKRITELVNVALTNLPATDNQQPLIAASKRVDVPVSDKDQKTRMTMNIGTLIGLKDEANEDEVQERVISLARLERRLLEVTEKETVADAMSVVIAAKDSATELEAARKSLKSWEERQLREEAASKSKEISSIIDEAVFSGRVSLKNTDRLEQLRRHGEEYGVAALKTAVSLMEPRPVRQYQAPAPMNTLKAQMAAIDRYKSEHPGATAGDAYVALAAKNPDLFGDDSTPVEE